LAESTEEASSKSFSQQLNGLRILVVDDEPDTLALVQLILERGGAEVKPASSAARGNEILDEWLPDLIVSDIGMAGVDGYEFMAGVRARPRDRGGLIPAIALTAYARTEDRIRALEAGYQMHIPKPVEPEELMTVIHALTRR
jgi:CheY-like chemotaxis protein